MEEIITFPDESIIPEGTPSDIFKVLTELDDRIELSNAWYSTDAPELNSIFIPNFSGVFMVMPMKDKL